VLLVGLVVVAWLAAGACVAVSAWHLRRLSRFRAPARATLNAELAAATGPEREKLEEELRERADDAQRALGLATLLPRSLARVSLATGTALALTSLAKGIGSTAALVPTGLVEFIAGFTGLTGCSLIGRQAKVLAGEMRLGWREALKLAERK
jgi:hypothetical protein